VWVSTAYWYNQMDDESRTTHITIVAVPLDTENGVEKFDHAETDLLLREDHL
jgi:hypothetical protein